MSRDDIADTTAHLMGSAIGTAILEMVARGELDRRCGIQVLERVEEAIQSIRRRRIQETEDLERLLDG